MPIKFSPPDISESEIAEVISTLKSGWITTGPKTRELEESIVDFTKSNGAVCLSSGTAGMEMVLRLFDIGPGDEVITTPYTYSATAAVILHTGATPVFADVKKDSFLIDPIEIEKKITPRTKAIIPVDIAGYPADYNEIFKVVINNKKFTPKPGTYQEKLGRILVLADAAHSLGAFYHGAPAGSIADFSSFSFHAVKNVTTCEGGVVTFGNLDHELNNPQAYKDIYKALRTLSLHGQSKDAINKTEPGNWEYDILYPGYKCNMTDLSASLGLVQLQRYKESLGHRRLDIFQEYINRLQKSDKFILPQFKDDNFGNQSSCHLFLLRLKNAEEKDRNRLISKLAAKGIPLNVHYKPLPMFSGYKRLGFNIKDYPNAYNQYKNQVTLPLHTLLNQDDIELITESLLNF